MSNEKTPTRSALLGLIAEHGLDQLLRDLGGICLTRNVLTNHGQAINDKTVNLTREQWMHLYRGLNDLASTI